MSTGLDTTPLEGKEPLRGDAQAIIEVTRAAAWPQDLNPEIPQSLVVPAGASLEIPDVEHFLPQPRRRRGTYRPATVDAFVDYTRRLANETTTVWVHPTSGRIVAVIDDHTPTEAAWREHTVELALQETPEWRYWLGADGRMMSQEEFAEHVEGGLEEIVNPDAAVMLEVAQTFHASTSAQFRSSTRLASGEQRLQYDEEVKAAAGGSGDLTVPTELVLAIAPFVGEDPYRVTARLRFRLRAGTLTLGYRLDRPEAVQRDALSKIADRLGEQFTNTYLGEPPTSSSSPFARALGS
jgi:uncharacterized protein YfdQ (DUF2303 family)